MVAFWLHMSGCWRRTVLKSSVCYCCVVDINRVQRYWSDTKWFKSTWGAVLNVLPWRLRLQKIPTDVRDQYIRADRHRIVFLPAFGSHNAVCVLFQRLFLADFGYVDCGYHATQRWVLLTFCLRSHLEDGRDSWMASPTLFLLLVFCWVRWRAGQDGWASYGTTAALTDRCLTS